MIGGLVHLTLKKPRRPDATNVAGAKRNAAEESRAGDLRHRRVASVMRSEWNDLVMLRNIVLQLLLDRQGNLAVCGWVPGFGGRLDNSSVFKTFSG